MTKNDFAQLNKIISPYVGIYLYLSFNFAQQGYTLCMPLIFLQSVLLDH